MEFQKYPKIHRLGKEEVDGILVGQCYIQEKIDGANTSIWLGDDGYIRTGSRNNDITGADFNGFNAYVQTHEGIRKCLMENPEYRLYGEWLVRHTVQYKETAYKKFYLYDIHIDGLGFLTTDAVYGIANQYDIETPRLFGILENPTEEELKKLVGQSDLGDIGEGIVIKNFEFVNKFGRMEYAKIVTESFKEENAIVFGGNNKHSESYWEMYVVNRYVTLARIQKIMHKIQPTLNRKLDMEDIPRITSTVYHDILTEEINEIAKKVPKMDFKKLKQLTMRKARQVYVDILNDSTSVADI